jgi:hypothetical protein
VFNELDNKNKLQFIQALLDKQFLGKEPETLTGLAKFAYISQMNSINSQVKGYEDKTGDILDDTPAVPPTVGGSKAPTAPPTEQVEVEVEGKGKGKGKFTPPPLNDLTDYFFEKLQSMDLAKFEAEKFNDFYSAKGWMIGKNKMKDWRAAVRNWIKGIEKNKNGKGDIFSEESVRTRMENW